MSTLDEDIERVKVEYAFNPRLRDAILASFEKLAEELDAGEPATASTAPAKATPARRAATETGDEADSGTDAPYNPFSPTGYDPRVLPNGLPHPDADILSKWDGKVPTAEERNAEREARTVSVPPLSREQVDRLAKDADKAWADSAWRNQPVKTVEGE